MESEKDRLRRERKERILQKSQQRLSKIVNTYSQSDLVTETDDMKQALQSEPKNTDLSEEIPPTYTEPTEESESKTTFQDPPRITPSFVTNDIEYPALDDEEEEPAPPKIPTSDSLAWIHAIFITSVCVVSFMYWLKAHAHDFFELEHESQNVWYKKTCRQLVFLQKYPTEFDFGFATTIHWRGFAVPVYAVFFTLEAILLGARFITQRVFCFFFNPRFQKSLLRFNSLIL
jgi:hypothetical protein